MDRSHPTKQGGAASSKPATDLDARLHAMRLGDPSPTSSPQQARYPPPTQLLWPSSQRALLPTATPAMRSLPQVFGGPTATPVVRRPPPSPPQPMPQVLVPTDSLDVRLQQVARQYRPQPLSYGGGLSGGGGGGGGGESFQGPGYVSPAGACSPSSVFASLYGKHRPHFNAAATPFSSVAPKSSKLNASARDYCPIARSHPSVAQSSSTPNSSASSFLPQPGAAAAYSARHDNASFDPYAQADSRLWDHAPAIGRLPTLEEVQARLLRTVMKPPRVTLAEASEHVVRLLAERGEEVRLSVLAGVKRDVHWFMGSREGHVVFLALLRACEGLFDELQGIVRAACNGEGFLMHVAKQDHGVAALKELIRVVAPYPQLYRPLIVCLLRERLIEQDKGAQLLQRCFTTLPYNDCSSIIRAAIANTSEMLSSAAGSRCLAECFAHARNGELRAFEIVILSHTSVIAKGEYSNYFLQQVLECGSNQLRERIVERVVEDIVGLSLHQFGSYVVEACFLLTGSVALLQRVLTAFLGLSKEQLGGLVQGGYSNYVVHKLLTAGKEHFPQQTLALARRIEKLPAEILKELHAAGVVKVVRKLLFRELQPRQ